MNCFLFCKTLGLGGKQMMKQVMQGHLVENTSDNRRGRKLSTDNLVLFVLGNIKACKLSVGKIVVPRLYVRHKKSVPLSVE